MKFIEIATPKAEPSQLDKQQMNQVIAEHLAYLRNQSQIGNLVFAGSTIDNVGGLIVYQAADEAAVTPLVQNDPLFQANAMNIQVHPFKTLSDLE